MDQYSRAWMQSPEGQRALAAQQRLEEAQQHNNLELDRFNSEVDKKARELDFIPEKLSQEKTFLNGLMLLDNDFFPNLREVFPDKSSAEINLSLLEVNDSSYLRDHYTSVIETKNLANAAKKKRVSNYFYEEVKDFSKGGMLDLFITYLKASRDFDAKRLAENPSLTDDDLKELMAQLSPEKSNSNFDFNDLDLFMAHPQVYDREQAKKIIKDKWFVAEHIIGYGYDLDTYWPSHMGMDKTAVEFRQKLDAASKKALGQSIYELNFYDKTYFDKLWAREQYDELIAQHDEEFRAKIKSSGSYIFLIKALSFDSDGLLKDNDMNKYLLPIIDEMITPEDEVSLSSYSGNITKQRLYLQNRALQGKLLDRNTLKTIINIQDSHADFLFAHQNELNKDVLKALYEDAWLYNKGSKSVQELKIEYQNLFGANIEDVKETWDKEYPVGSSRFDIFIKERNIGKIISEYQDAFFNLPVEQTEKVIGEAFILCEKDLKVKPEYQRVSDFASRYIDKYGLDVFLKNVSNYNAKDFLAIRYMQGVRKPKEVEYLRKYFSNNEVLEAEFNKSGDTLKNISHVPDLLEAGRFDIADIIMKRGYTFDDEEQKYNVLDKFVRASLYYFKDDSKKQKYVDDFIKNANIDWKKAELCHFFSAKLMLDFMLERYGKNPAVSKKDLEYMLDKARRTDGVSEKATENLHKLGYNFKPYLAYKLIEYGKGRSISIFLQDRDLSQYDFDAKFLQNFPYHPSSDSHTTFLNETLQYWKKEAAVTALNHGASPFTKAGFFRDKFEAMPFNMMFSKALKENKTTELKEFMGYIAANLDESKKGVLKDIWTSLGQKLRDDTRVQSIIRDTDKILKSRDFVQERIDKELKLKAEEERRKQQEEQARIERERRLAEEKRREEERRLAEEKQKHEQALLTLRESIFSSMPDIISMDNKEIVQKIAQYLEQNKAELPVVPNADELSAIKVAAFELKTEKLKIKQEQDAAKQAQMSEAVRIAIEEKEKETDSILSPKDIDKFVTKYFEKDVEAKPFVASTIKIFSEEAKEKLEIQDKLTHVEEVAADKLIEFYENDEAHGFNYFNNVGKERQNWGYTNVALNVMQELKLPTPNQDIMYAPKKEQDLFFRVKDNVMKLVEKSNAQYYYDEKQGDWVDNRYDFLADIAGYEPAETEVDEKELLKQAKKDVKKNKKGESIVNSLAGLAALKEKFGKSND